MDRLRHLGLAAVNLQWQTAHLLPRIRSLSLRHENANRTVISSRVARFLARALAVVYLFV